MVPLIDSAIADLEHGDTRSDAPSRLGFFGWMLVKMLEPPTHFKTRTAAAFEPVDVPSPLGILAALEAENEKLVVLAGRAAGLKTAVERIQSPFDARAKYNVYPAFRFIAAHLRRHIWQAEQTARRVVLARVRMTKSYR